MKSLIGLIACVFLLGCQSSKLPTERYSQFTLNAPSYYLEGDVLKVELSNPLACPLRIWIGNADKELDARLNSANPVVVAPESDTLLAFSGVSQFNDELSFDAALGDPEKEIKTMPMELPFPAGKTYRIMQGNHGSFSHYTDYSKYALDFNLADGDTVCAAMEGQVVGVIKDYEFGGSGAEWRPYSNFITIYNPASGLFTQYVHLKKDGSFVKVGDQVRKGQPIGLSGITGQTDGAHLHFNVLIPYDKELRSTPYEFMEGYKSEELKRGDVVSK